MGAAVLAICAGASLGALLRWALALRLNPLLPSLPLGTLAANLVGGFLIGVAMGWLERHPELPPQVRLLIVTGFLGGLTTFSTFSAEVVLHLHEGRLLWALVLAASHLAGSLVLTFLGLAAARAIT